MPPVYALTWDPTITAGSVIEGVVLLLTVVAAYNGLTNRLVRFETTIEAQAERLDQHEHKLTEVSERMQHLLGRLESREGRLRDH